MNFARSLRSVKPLNISQNLRNYRVTCTNYESTPTTQPQVQEEKFDFEDVNVIDRNERRKPQIPPFMKNVMVSVFNRDLFAYPEILNKDESTDLENRVNKIENVFKNEENTSVERKNILLQTGMYRAPVRLTAGGLAMNVTERLRYLESMSTDLHLCKGISDHWVGLNAVISGVKEEVLQSLLPNLISGEHTISLCNKETIPIRVAQADFRTSALLDQHGVWRITGEKICHNASGYLLVLSKVEGMRISAFLVEPNAQGVNYATPCVTFRDTPAIQLEQISDSALAGILGMSRLDTAVLSYSLLKQTILNVVKYVRGKYHSGKPLAESKLIQSKIGESLLNVYAAESMAYFTAGLLDEYYDPDADLEMAMCRAFITKHGLRSILDLVAIPGLEGIEDSWQSCIDDFRKLSVQEEALDNVNMFIGLTSLQYAGKHMVEEVQQLRNPLFHPTVVLKKMWTNRNQESDTPTLDLMLKEHLHPALHHHADSLEYCVVRLKFACETILTRHGTEVTKALTEIERLAQVGTEVFAMAAVLARASRSYCIGLRNADVEMQLGGTFTSGSREFVKKAVIDLVDGEYLNLDHFKINLGGKVLDTNTLLVEKPIERSFW